MYVISLVTAKFSQLSIFTADCHHPIQMAGVETVWELYTLIVINSWFYRTATTVHSFDAVVGLLFL